MVFQGKEVPKFDFKKHKCPACNAGGRLVGHGTYERKVVQEGGEVEMLNIQRVRCRACSASHSLVYDFLVPYRQLSLSALKEAAEGYLTRQNSYLSALTNAVKDPATLFSALENALHNLPVVWMRLTERLILNGFRAADLKESAGCPNSYKCYKPGKAERLDWLAQVLELVPDVFEKASGMAAVLFSSGRGCGLLRTHSPECALF